jgi:hypothetical protein
MGGFNECQWQQKMLRRSWSFIGNWRWKITYHREPSTSRAVIHLNNRLWLGICYVSGTVSGHQINRTFLLCLYGSFRRSNTEIEFNSYPYFWKGLPSNQSSGLYIFRKLGEAPKDFSFSRVFMAIYYRVPVGC